MLKMIQGVSLNEFLRGFWGQKNEGVQLLECMKLPIHRLPFDIKTFLTNRSIEFLDGEGNKASVCYKAYDEYFEFDGIYLEHHKQHRLYREWEGDDIEMVNKLESEAIGECVRGVLWAQFFDQFSYQFKVQQLL